MTFPSPEKVDLSIYIEQRLFGDRPHIRGRRIPVATIAYNSHDNQLPPAQLAHDFGLSEAEVLAALLYYEEHRPIIDSQEQEEARLFNEIVDTIGNE